MSNYKCPQYSGQGAGAGRATCEFFSRLDAHLGADGKIAVTIILIILMYFPLRYLRTGKVL